MAEEVVDTVTKSKLPYSVPQTIIVGDTYRSQVFRHLEPDGVTYIDTSLWDITSALYAGEFCGAAAVQVLTVEKQPGPKWGYLVSLTDVETAALDCATLHMRIPTDDGVSRITYIAGPATVTEA